MYRIYMCACVECTCVRNKKWKYNIFTYNEVSHMFTYMHFYFFFRKWSRGEPNSIKETCVEMYTYPHSLGQWNDMTCESEAAVCEIWGEIFMEKKVGKGPILPKWPTSSLQRCGEVAPQSLFKSSVESRYYITTRFLSHSVCLPVSFSPPSLSFYSILVSCFNTTCISMTFMNAVVLKIIVKKYSLTCKLFVQVWNGA